MRASKYYTAIYTGKYDADKRITTAEDLFQPVINTIKNNKLVQFTEDSLLMQNFKNYLVPYFSNTYQNFIHSTRLAVYGYERYLLNSYQLVKINRLFL